MVIKFKIFIFSVFITKLFGACHRSLEDQLYTAVFIHDLETAQLALENGADENGIDKYGWTPIHNAIFMRDIDMVKLLIKNEANIEILMESAWTPLQWAISLNCPEIVNLLLQKGADINHKNKNHSPLTWAVIKNFPDVIKLLLLAKLNHYIEYDALLEFHAKDKKIDLKALEEEAYHEMAQAYESQRCLEPILPPEIHEIVSDYIAIAPWKHSGSTTL